MATQQMSYAVLLLVLCSLAAAAARPLQRIAAVPLPEPSAQPGNLTGRVLTRKVFKAQGGAFAMLGRPALLQLKRASRFVGSVESLATHLETEKDLGVDTINTKLLYQCKGLTANVSDIERANAAGATAAGAVVAADPTLTAAQAFSLSSRPSSPRKIFLDFDGHTTTGTNWNSLAGRDPIVTPPYDKDNSPSTWSADELADIVAIWRSVAEDYAMFDVDVTTVDPGNAALTNSGIRVAIGGAYTDWYNNAAGGVAYVGSFGVPNTPCFIFTQNLGPNYAKFVWEAVSHEVGHTLGLYHDGVTGGSSYYSGDANGGWAPIMGTGYYKTLTQFSRGEYAGANNQQDDLAIIGGFLPLVSDGFGSSMATATALNATVSAGVATATASGVVSTADGDWFQFQAATGTATLSAANVAPWAAGGASRANVDLQLVVYNAAGTALATINPPPADASNLNLDVPATAVALPADGTYYVAVTGAGFGTPAVGAGYSAYASRGQFELKAAYAPCTTCSGSGVQVLASPSPSPVASSPSPSPSPVPSPSPSPVPSPSPSPSPSPAPVEAMRVTAISISKAPQGSKFACTVTVYVKNAANQALVGAALSGSWSSSTLSAWSSVTSTTYTASTGTVSFRSGTLSKSNVCTFSVNSAALAGFYFDTVNSVMTKSLTV